MNIGNLATKEHLERCSEEAAQSGDFETARNLQRDLVRTLERSPESTHGQLGDALYLLAFYCFKLGEYKSAQIEAAKAIGFRRLFFGRGHAKLNEAMELARQIQFELSKTEVRRTRRKTVSLN